ncbi:S-layer homology domain-containing protein [Bacillus thuringiensis]|uniref:S-layer protein n=1 Tax=Bacillus thuringiensis TaxID=1428 RepID=A0A9X6ZUN3_BACTU|nr:S-layer homology domain-containing protein [Bacillus thuringiensis]PFJ42727.1 hypothetical protein COJ15_05135 [Bacillus thuringiensis]
MIKQKFLKIALASALCFQYFIPIGNIIKVHAATTEATSLTASKTDTTVSLNWTNPVDATFDHTNIYRDGTLLGSVKKNNYSIFHDSNLLKNTTYSYKVTSVDVNGEETEGNSISITTDSVASNEVLKGLWMVIGTDAFTGTKLTNKTTDRITNTTTIYYSGSTDTIWTELPTTYDVDSYALKAPGAGSLKLTLYNEQKQVIATVNNTDASGNRAYFPVAYGVKYVAFENTSGSLKDVDEMYLYKAEGPYELSGLNASKTDRTVSLNWINPPQKDLDYLNIYRDGNLIGKVKNNALPIYHDETVEPNTTYSYRVTAVDKYNNNGVISSKETTGLTTTVTTDSTVSNELLKGLWMIQGPNIFSGTTLTNKTTDRIANTTTNVYYSGNATDTIWTELPTTYDVDSYALKAPGAGSLKMTLYNDQKQVVATVNKTDDTGNRVYFPMASNVKYVAFENTSQSLKTVDEIYLYKVKDVAEISGLQESHSHRDVTLSWDNPNDNSIVSYNTYRDGTKIANTTNLTYTDNTVSPNKKYKYTVKAVNDLGKESLGATIDVTTNSIPEVTNLKEVHTNNTVKINWVNPEISNLHAVNVYRNGVKIASVTGNSFEDTNLLAKTNYSYTLKVEDTNSYESSGSPIHVTTNPNAPMKPIIEVTKTTYKEITVKWDTVQDADTYTLKQNGSVIYTGAKNTFEVLNLKPATSYQFEVSAANITGTSEPASIQAKTVNEPGNINIEFFFKEFPKAVSYEITRDDLKWTYHPSDAVNGYIYHREENVEGNKIYKYTIRVKNSLGEVIKEIEATIDVGQTSQTNDEVKKEIDWESTNEVIPPVEETKPPVDGNNNESSKDELGTKKEYMESGKLVEEVTISKDSLDNYLKNNTGSKTINVCSSDVAEVQKIKLPVETVDTLKEKNVTIECGIQSENIKLKPENIVLPPKAKEIQIETSNGKKEVQENLNGGTIEGDIWAGIELTFIDETGNEIDMSHHEGGAKVEVPFFSKEDIHEWNVYKYNEETGTYDVIRSKSREGYKVFEIEGIGGNYLFGKFDKQFEDIPTRHWASKVIEFMADKHFIDGTGDKTFDPDNQVTRAEFTSMLVKAMGYKNPSLKESKFKDVNKDTWYYQDVLIAEEHNLIRGISNTAFAPEQTLTREQMLAILVRVMEKEGATLDVDDEDTKNVTTKFKDFSNVSQWASKSIAKSVKYGITVGTSESSITPKTDSTRAQSAAFIQRTMKQLEWY